LREREHAFGVGASPVQQHGGSTVLWLGCAAVGVVVAAGQLASGPARERRAAALRRAATDMMQPVAPPPVAAGHAAVPAP